ncbi:MAG TPA: response regulator, partial [Albitalea sp.]
MAETTTRSRVLCVDDEPGIVRSLRWLLQKDFDVTTAQSGQEALPLVESHDFDVVISDQRMPGMMGSEFLNEVRRKSPRSMRILLTGYSDMPAILRSINDSEIFRFVSKPWDVAELPKLVAQAAHIARNHAADAAAPEAAEATDTAGEAVLVIDDDPAVAQLLAEALGPSGRIVHAKSLVEAAAAVREDNVGIVVADTYVARRGTTALLKLLKREDPGIVSIVYTAAADAVD